MAGLHVTCGGVLFPFVYQNWNIGAGRWLTCVQRPVCSFGLRTKLKIRCDSPETQWHWVEDWIIRRTEKLKVTASPRWCVRTLNKGRMFRRAVVTQPHRLVLKECIAVCWRGRSLWRLLKAQIWRYFYIAIFGTLCLPWLESIPSPPSAALLGRRFVWFLIFVVNASFSCDTEVIMELCKNNNTKEDKSLLLSHSLQTPKKGRLYFEVVYLFFPVYKHSWTLGGILFRSTTNLLSFLNDCPKCLQLISVILHQLW